MLIVRCGNKKEWKSPLKTFGRNEWTLNYQQKSLNLLRSYLDEDNKKEWQCHSFYLVGMSGL